ETDTCVLGEDAFGAAKKRLDERVNCLWGELLAGVLDSEHHTVGVSAGRDPHGALPAHVVDDRVLHEVRGQLPQERVRAERRRHFAGGLDGDATLFCEGEERFSGFFRDEGQVDVYWG